MKIMTKRTLIKLLFAFVGLIAFSSVIYLYHHTGAGGRRTIAAKINSSELRELSLKPIDDSVAHAYSYRRNEFRVIPSLGKERFNTMVNGQLPVFECNGFKFVILHKWVNSSWGIAYGTESPTNFPPRFEFERTQDDLWIWSLDLERESDSY